MRTAPIRHDSSVAEKIIYEMREVRFDLTPLRQISGTFGPVMWPVISLDELHEDYIHI